MLVFATQKWIITCNWSWRHIQPFYMYVYCITRTMYMYIQHCIYDLHVAYKLGPQYDAGASVVSWMSGWRCNRLDFYSSVASPVLASVQPIRLLKCLTSGKELDWWKNAFPVMLTTLVTLAVPASHCEPGFTHPNCLKEFSEVTCTCTLCMCTVEHV